MIISSIRQQLLIFPLPVRIFIARATGYILGWELIYRCFLRPYKVPDTWLTRLTAEATAALLSLVYKPVHVEPGRPMHTLWMDGRKILWIADGCNGLEIFLIYIVFLLCYPGARWGRIAGFGIAGLLMLFIVNIIRCAMIAWLNVNAPNFSHFAHHYVFTLVVYSMIFYCWVLFTRRRYENQAHSRY